MLLSLTKLCPSFIQVLAAILFVFVRGSPVGFFSPKLELTVAGRCHLLVQVELLNPDHSCMLKLCVNLYFLAHS